MSRQEINLYQPVAKGVRGALSARSTSTSLVLVCATLTGLWGFAFWQTGRLQEAAQVVRSQQQAQAALSAAQGPQLVGLPDEELEALLVRLANDYDHKSRALAMLNSESQQRAAGFSSRLRAFAARHIDGIWLDRLTLGARVESVSVSGSTVSPDSVPRYLRSLAQDPALKGGQIDEFVIERPKDKKSAGSGRLSFHAGHRGLVAPQIKEES
jgi:Tfp pilus assembly protein PilN